MPIPGDHRANTPPDQSIGGGLLLALAVQSVAEDLEPEGILRRTVELSCAMTAAEHAMLAVDGDAGDLGEMITHGDPGQLNGAHTLALPLFVDGQMFGTLHLGGRERPFAGRDTQSITLLLRAAGAALAQSRERSSYAAQRVASDRDRIAGDLRELVEERLRAVADELRRVLGGHPDDRARIEAALEGVELAERDVHTAVFELRQGADTPLDALRQVVEEYADVLGFPPVLRLSGSAALLHEELGDHVLDVVREALAGVARQAEATAVSVELDASPAWLMLSVTDDGADPDPAGLESGEMRELAARTRILGGVLRRTPAEPRGTRLDWLVPVRRRRSVGGPSMRPARNTSGA